MNGRIRGAGALLCAAFLYGIFGVLSRLIGYELPLFYQTGLRSVLAAGILGLIILQTGSYIRVKAGDRKWIVSRAVVGQIGILSFFVAVNALPLGTVYFLFYGASTVFGYLIGSFLYRERISGIRLLSLVLAIGGLLRIYSLSIGSGGLLPAAASVLAGTATAIWNTFPKKISGSYGGVQIALLDNAYGSVAALVFSLLMHETWMLPAVTVPWLANAGIGVLYVATGLLVVYGFHRLDAQIGSLVMLAEVVFGILFGFLLYQETISLGMMLGAILIFAAIMLPEVDSTGFIKKRRQAA